MSRAQENSLFYITLIRKKRKDENIWSEIPLSDQSLLNNVSFILMSLKKGFHEHSQ